MVEDEILQNFLSNAVKNAKRQIEEEGQLTVENAIPLLLQSQFNHIIHLDYELSNLRKIFDERFEMMDGRFESMDGRFEKRFEKIDERFEKIDERFEKIDGRFEKIDERFEKMDGRFEKMDERFDQINKKIGWTFGVIVALIGLGFTYLGSLISIIKYVK